MRRAGGERVEGKTDMEGKRQRGEGEEEDEGKTKTIVGRASGGERKG